MTPPTSPPSAPIDDVASRLARIAARAETLVERLERARTDSAPVVGDVSEALAGWQRAYAPGDPAALERRLGWDGLDPSTAARAIGAQGERAPDSPLPEWADLARKMGLGTDLRQAPELPLDLTSVPFVELWSPLVGMALAAYAQARETAIPAESMKVLVRGLAEEMARVAGVAAFERFRRRREADPAPGVYERFVAEELASGLLDFAEEFPVAMRQLVRLASTWYEALTELLARVERDRPALAERFAAGAELGPIAVVERVDSDRHAGGRVVFRVAFASGLELAAKPRSLAVEAAYAGLVGWLAEAGFPDLPPAPEVLDRGDHGWMRWERSAPLADRGALETWWRRAGALIALAELLGAEDLHAENIVAVADGPLVVDAEMLLQPDRAGAAGRERRERFTGGLLRRAGEAGRVAAWAGLHPVEERVVTERGRGWSGLGTDALAPVPVPVVARPLANVPAHDGRPTSPQEFAVALVAGYRSTWRRLLDVRDRLVAADGPLDRFAGAPLRLLLRASQEYATVLDLAATPRHQRDALGASLLLEAMARPFASATKAPRAWPLIAAERAALEGLDVPRFEIAADGLDATADGVRAEGVVPRSALAATRARLAELTEAQIERRVEAVVEALAPDAGVRIELEPPAGEGAVARALVVADRIVAFDLDPRRARSAGDRPRRLEERLLDLALYDGRLGRAFVLASADRVDGGSRLTAVLPALLEDLDRFATDSEGADLPVGGLTGLGSIVWTLVAIVRASGRGELLDMARRYAGRLTGERLAADERLDVEGGAAGALLALLALAEATGEASWREAATAAGERLLVIRTPQPEGGAAWVGSGGRALAGYAHGAAGIARALAALGAATGDPRFAAAVADALAFERALYDPAHGNWPVRRAGAVSGDERVIWMTAYCHGAPGIAIGRTLLPPSARDEQVGEELASAVAATLAAGEGSHDHLCCGAAGRALALARAALDAGSPELGAFARGFAASLLERPARLPRSPRDPAAAEAGLFRGVGGLAWLALFLDRANEPALLDPAALELPSEAEARAARVEEMPAASSGALRMTESVEITTLEAGTSDPRLAAMTFPIYRSLLDLAPASRHPEQGDTRRIQPVAVVARAGGEPVGLALGELPVDSGPAPELLSLFVAAEARRTGIGSALVAAFEQEVARRGFGELAAVYTAGKPSIAAVERIFARRGWEEPRPRTLSVRFPPEAALASDLFSERRMRALGAGLELVPWVELGAEERAEIRRSHERAPWITPALAPWRFEAAGFDPVSSIGARYRGEVVGWVINHVVDPRTVRFTCSFMRKDISRRGRIVPLYRASLERLAAAGVPRATFITPVVYPNMIRFIRRWIEPIAEFVGETRGTRKQLGGAAGAASRP